MNCLKKADAIVSALMLLVMVVLVCYQVFTRYALGSSSDWSEELVSWAFLWLTWLGISALYDDDDAKHISIDLLPEVSGNLSKMIDILSQTLQLCLLILIAYLVIQFVQKPYIYNQHSVVLGWSVIFLYLCIIVGSIGAAIRIAFAIFKNIKTNEKVI